MENIKKKYYELEKEKDSLIQRGRIIQYEIKKLEKERELIAISLEEVGINVNTVNMDNIRKDFYERVKEISSTFTQLKREFENIENKLQFVERDEV
jgi:predicted metal-dependent hydrolase